MAPAATMTIEAHKRDVCIDGPYHYVGRCESCEHYAPMDFWWVRFGQGDDSDFAVCGDCAELAR